jgi:hypothetical protein
VRPHSLEIIQGLQNVLITHIMPELRSSYAQAQAMYMILLLGVLTRYWDGRVQALDDDNREMRGLFEDAAEALGSVGTSRRQGEPDALAAELRGEAGRTSTSLRMTDLLEENNRLRALLARLAVICDRAEIDPALSALKPLRLKLVEHMRREVSQRIVPIMGS